MLGFWCRPVWVPAGPRLQRAPSPELGGWMPAWTCASGLELCPALEFLENASEERFPLLKLVECCCRLKGRTWRYESRRHLVTWPQGPRWVSVDGLPSAGGCDGGVGLPQEGGPGPRELSRPHGDPGPRGTGQEWLRAWGSQAPSSLSPPARFVFQVIFTTSQRGPSEQ